MKAILYNFTPPFSAKHDGKQWVVVDCGGRALVLGNETPEEIICKEVAKALNNQARAHKQALRYCEARKNKQKGES